MEKIHDDLIVKEGGAGVPSTRYSDSDEWLRLPKPGGRLYGLSRTSLTELTIPSAVNGFETPVRSLLTKKRGAARGIRLIDKQSLDAYLNRLADEQERGASGRNANAQASA